MDIHTAQIYPYHTLQGSGSLCVVFLGFVEFQVHPSHAVQGSGSLSLNLFLRFVEWQVPPLSHYEVVGFMKASGIRDGESNGQLVESEMRKATPGRINMCPSSRAWKPCRRIRFLGYLRQAHMRGKACIREDSARGAEGKCVLGKQNISGGL